MTTSQGPEPTVHRTEAELDAALAEFEKGESSQGSQTDGKKPKGNATTTTTTTTTTANQKVQGAEDDPLQRELDEAAAEAGLTVAKTPEGQQQNGAQTTQGQQTQTQTQASDADAPEDNAPADQYKAWLDSLSKGARTKIERLTRQLGEARAQASERFELKPTWEHPLADVANEQTLDAQMRHHQTVAHECRRLLREGTFDGGAEITLANGKRHAFKSEEEIKDALDWSDRVLNEIPNTRDRLRERARLTPWESAVKLAPEIYAKGSAANTLALEMLNAAPQLKALLPDYEVRIAHMARSMQMEQDEAPTTEFPKGKAKWVRLELDGKGQVVTRKAPASAEVAANTKPLSEAAPQAAPVQNRPALQKPGKDGIDVRQSLANAEKNLRDEDSLDQAIRDFEKAA